MLFTGEKFKPQKDRYSKKRGPSRFLYIACGECETPTMVYQKDGPGRLHRYYTDRVVWPPELVTTLAEVTSDTIKGAGALACTACENVLGLPMIYEPENRPAFSAVPGTVHAYRSAEQAQARAGKQPI